MSQSDQQVYRERATKDTASIIELRQNASFQNYFMRRLDQSMQALMRSLKYDVISPEEREVVRQKLLFCEEIVKWTSDGELASCERIAKGQ